METEAYTKTTVNRFSGKYFYVGYHGQLIEDTAGDVVVVDTFSGTKNRGFGRIIADRGNAVSPYTGDKFKVNIAPTGTMWTKNYDAGNKIAWEELLYGNGPWQISFYDVRGTSTAGSTALPLAIGSFYQSVQQAMTEIQGMVIAGEASESLHMLEGRGKFLLSSFEEYMQKARAFARSSRRSVLQEINQLYLEYTYGWAPLISDINKIAKIAQEGFKANPAPRVHGLGSYTISGNNVTTSGNPNNFGCIINTKDEGVHEFVLGGALSLRDDEMTSIKMSGFNWHEFAPTIYELIPYSFVADYFSNLGRIITAYSYADVGFNYGYTIERVVGKRQFVANCVTNNSIYAVASNACGGSFTYDTELCRSSRISGLPTLSDLSLVFRRPNARQVFNVASLLLQKVY